MSLIHFTLALGNSTWVHWSYLNTLTTTITTAEKDRIMSCGKSSPST